jgi:hypothetical protein
MKNTFQGLLLSLTAGLVLLSAFIPEAQADRRIFGFSYPYMTLPKGGLEIEHYLDASFAPADDPDTATEVEDAVRPSYRHQLEVEYAITDHWDFGLYQVFEQKAHKDFTYKGSKLRSRYRFGEQGDYFVDPAIYGEVIYYGDTVKIEEILILGRSFNAVEMSLNLKFEQEFELDHDEIVHEFVPSFGVGYHVNEWFAFSAEYFGKQKIVDGEAEDMGHFAGPSIAVQGKSFWWTLSYVHQVSGLDSFADFQVRSIFAIVL